MVAWLPGPRHSIPRGHGGLRPSYLCSLTQAAVGPRGPAVRCLPQCKCQIWGPELSSGEKGVLLTSAPKGAREPTAWTSCRDIQSRGGLTSKLAPGLTVLGMLAGGERRLGRWLPAQREAAEPSPWPQWTQPWPRAKAAEDCTIDSSRQGRSRGGGPDPPLCTGSYPAVLAPGGEGSWDPSRCGGRTSTSPGNSTVVGESKCPPAWPWPRGSEAEGF